MKVYQLHKKQLLKTTLEDAWSFFSTPKNLNDITPSDMNFKILGGHAEPMFAGQIIRYKINPIANFPMSWITEITHCVPEKYFIDEQRFGPFKLWHHMHRFTETEEGVLMEDILHYSLPLGWAGRLVAGSFVEKKVKNIFEHRFEKLENLFNQKSVKPDLLKQSVV